MSRPSIKKSLEDEIKFELDFFSYIAGTEHFEVLTLPYDLTDGHEFTEEEIQQIAIDSKKRNIKLIYRVTMSNEVALVYTSDPEIIGMVPESDARGFYC
jgi:hypothetical protein